MRHLSIALRIKLGFAICLLFFIISGIVSYKGIHTLSAGFNDYTILSQETQTSSDINARFLEMRLASQQFHATLDPEFEAQYQKNLEALNRDLDALISQTTQQQTQSNLKQVKANVESFDNAYEAMKQSQQIIHHLVNVEMLERESQALSAAQKILFESYNNDDSNASLYAGMLMENFLLAKIAVINYSNSGDQESLEAANDLFEYSLPGIEADIESLESSDYQTKLIGKFAVQRKAYAESFEKVHQQMLENQSREQSLYAYEAQLSKAVAAAQAVLNTQKQALTPKLQSTEQQTIQVIVGLALITLVVSAISAALVTRSISRGINQVKDITDELSRGNLNIEVEVMSKNEIGKLLENMKITIESLRDIVGKVNESSVRVGEMSESLNTVTSNSESSANQLSNEMDNISQSVIQLTDSTSEISSSASHASTVAQLAASNVEMGLKEVDKTLFEIDSAENRMQESSNKVESLHKESLNIGAILEVIQGVTEQTNLLALNAAIEAARAGEHGRGFAVVADEVRTLAQRTQDSASQIDQLISSLQRGAEDALESIHTSHNTVSQASVQAKQASQNLHTINEHIQQLNDANQQIATSAENQDHLTKSLEQNAQHAAGITADNQASVQSISQAAQDLIEVANNLEHQVKRFES